MNKIINQEALNAADTEREVLAAIDTLIAELHKMDPSVMQIEALAVMERGSVIYNLSID